MVVEINQPHSSPKPRELKLANEKMDVIHLLGLTNRIISKVLDIQLVLITTTKDSTVYCPRGISDTSSWLVVSCHVGLPWQHVLLVVIVH